jgi:hypothetical protein
MFFVGAVALFATALGDALVEALSNAQLLWHGSYTDRSSLDLLPLGLLALAAFGSVVGVVSVARLRLFGWSARVLAFSTTRTLTPRTALRVLPAIFALQLVTLYATETLEQIAVLGHSAGGTLWLGGPVGASIVIHLVLAVCCTLGLARLLALISAAVVAIVARALVALGERARSGFIRVGRSGERARERGTLVAVHLGKRGPPGTNALA